MEFLVKVESALITTNPTLRSVRNPHDRDRNAAFCHQLFCTYPFCIIAPYYETPGRSALLGVIQGQGTDLHMNPALPSHGDLGEAWPKD